MEDSGSAFRLLWLSRLGVDGLIVDRVDRIYHFGPVHLDQERFTLENAPFCWQLCKFAAIAREARFKECTLDDPLHHLRGRGSFYDLFCAHQDKSVERAAEFDAFTTKLASSSANHGDYHSILHDNYRPPSSGAMFCSGRCFFVTTKGFVGIGVPSIRTGDLVAVLFGLSIPFILRDYEEYQTFVGAAWVNGIMDGELIPLFERGVLQKTPFIIQ